MENIAKLLIFKEHNYGVYFEMRKYKIIDKWDVLAKWHLYASVSEKYVTLKRRAVCRNIGGEGSPRTHAQHGSKVVPYKIMRFAI